MPTSRAGLLYVLGELNNEHGQAQVNLPFVKSGCQYQAVDPPNPKWMVCYSIDDISQLETPEYKRLIDERAQNEIDTTSHHPKCLDRRVFALIASHGSLAFPGPVLVAVTLEVSQPDTEQLEEWYEEEHTNLLSKVPGWLRTRLFRRTDDKNESGHIEYLALHEYTAENGLGGPEHEEARSTPWRNEIMKLAKVHQRRTFSFYQELVTESQEQEEH